MHVTEAAPPAFSLPQQQSGAAVVVEPIPSFPSARPLKHDDLMETNMQALDAEVIKPPENTSEEEHVSN